VRVRAERLWFPSADPNESWEAIVSSQSRNLSWQVEVEPDSVPTIAELIRDAYTIEDVGEFRAAWHPTLSEIGLSEFFETAEPVSTDSSWRPLDRPGLYRREHASVIISTGSSVLMVDPQGLAGGWTTAHGRYPTESHPLTANGLLLTHTHTDH
jgi:hypothetical protein